MSHILADLPIHISVLVRKEFTQNLKSGHGEYLKAHIIAIRCQAGFSLQFQVRFEEGTEAGALFCLPIQALCWKPCGKPPGELLQPWDTFSSNFCVHEFGLLRNSTAWLLNVRECEGFPVRLKAKYLVTVDFEGNALADNFEQHKQLHILQVEEGWFAAVPNNRMLSDDSAFGKVGDELLRFQSLEVGFCGECSVGMPESETGVGWHNPENISADRLGAGYRFLTKDEKIIPPDGDLNMGRNWIPSGHRGGIRWPQYTYRTATPLPE